MIYTTQKKSIADNHKILAQHFELISPLTGLERHLPPAPKTLQLLNVEIFQLACVTGAICRVIKDVTPFF